MKKHVLIGLITGLLITLITMSNSYAASSYSLTFAETYAEKLVCYKSFGYCDVIGAGKFTVSSSISMSGIDTTKFDSTTPFFIQVEGFTFGATLGEGGFTNPKKTKANYVVSDVDIDGISRKYLTISLTWSKTKMTVKVTCTTAPWDIEYPIIADSYLGETTSISDPLYAQINIGDLSVGFDLTATGKITTKTTNKKSYGLYDTSSASIKASGSGSVLVE
jgi:hypothetical protein